MMHTRNKLHDTMFLVSNDFGLWLQQRRDERGTSQAELARMAGLNRAIISKIENGQSEPMPDTLTAIARALRIPPEEVFRQAGVLPPRPEEDPLTQEAEYLLSGLSKELREQAVTYIRFLYQQEVGNGKSTAAGVGKAQPKTP